MSRIGKLGLVSAGAAIGAALVGPLLIPVRPMSGKKEPREVADADSRFITVQGVDIHYKMLGSGNPAFILLHGFLASTYTWREVMAPLAKLGAVVAFDRPAFGLTQRLMPGEWTSNPYSPKAALDITVELMDALDIDRATLVGSSAGGTVALQVALAHPERVNSLILVDAAVYTAGPPAWLSPILRSPQMRRLGPLLLRKLPEWGPRMGQAAWYDPERYPAERWTSESSALAVANWDYALWEFVLAHEPPELADRLREIRQPTLVITGDTDRVVPTAHSTRLAKEIPGAELVVIPACGHLPHEERPEQFLEAVLAFMR